MSLTVEGPNQPEQGEFRWSILVSEDRDNTTLQASLTDALAELDGPVQLWIREVNQRADEVAADLGFRRYRDLWQLRCGLPNLPSMLTTRAFTPADIDAFVGVNNRAFHWHPEQSGLTAASVRESMGEPWFNPDGFRLLHAEHASAEHPSADRASTERAGAPAEGELIGFCWTKVHADVEPNLGEIYVIAIDPSQHGKGLGKPMTLAGLEWMSEHGLSHAMLYVESDNDAANATYTNIGFSRHHTDRAYRLER